MRSEGRHVRDSPGSTSPGGKGAEKELSVCRHASGLSPQPCLRRAQGTQGLLLFQQVRYSQNCVFPTSISLRPAKNLVKQNENEGILHLDKVENQSFKYSQRNIT